MKTSCVGMLKPNHSRTSQHEHIKGIFLIHCNFHSFSYDWALALCFSFSLQRSNPRSTASIVKCCFYADVAHNTFYCASDFIQPFLSRIFFKNFHYFSTKLNFRAPSSWAFPKNLQYFKCVPQSHGNSKKTQNKNKQLIQNTATV